MCLWMSSELQMQTVVIAFSMCFFVGVGLSCHTHIYRMGHVYNMPHSIYVSSSALEEEIVCILIFGKNVCL